MSVKRDLEILMYHHLGSKSILPKGEVWIVTLYLVKQDYSSILFIPLKASSHIHAQIILSVSMALDCILFGCMLLWLLKTYQVCYTGIEKWYGKLAKTDELQGRLSPAPIIACLEGDLTRKTSLITNIKTILSWKNRHLFTGLKSY